MSVPFRITGIDLAADWRNLEPRFPCLAESFLLVPEHLAALRALKPDAHDASFVIEGLGSELLFAGLRYEVEIGLVSWPVQALAPKHGPPPPALFEHGLQHLKSLGLPFRCLPKFPASPEGFAPHLEEVLELDLSLSEEEILRQTRKSYRSLFNWGKSHLRLDLRDAGNIDEASFDEFTAYYDKISQRTKPAEYWRALLAMVKNGRGFLLFAYFEHRLVAATLVLHGSAVAYYALGAYDRELMAQRLAISHWPIFSGILHAKKIGLARFELGFLDLPAKSDKERNIFNFKKGFVETASSRRLYGAPTETA